MYIFQLLTANCTPAQFNDSNLTDLKGFIRRFQGAIDEIDINSLCGENIDGEFIFTLMEKSNVIFFAVSIFVFSSILDFFDQISYRIARKIIELIDTIFDFLAEAKRLSKCGSGLRKFSEILWVPFSDDGKEFQADVKRHYRVYAYLKKDDRNCKVIVPHVKICNFWCFSAKFV